MSREKYLEITRLIVYSKYTQFDGICNTHNLLGYRQYSV